MGLIAPGNHGFLPIHEANGSKNAGYDPSFYYAVETTYGSPYLLGGMLNYYREAA
jgi:1,4-alpha-glucan branching enzyme